MTISWFEADAEPITSEDDLLDHLDRFRAVVADADCAGMLLLAIDEENSIDLVHDIADNLGAAVGLTENGHVWVTGVQLPPRDTRGSLFNREMSMEEYLEINWDEYSEPENPDEVSGIFLPGHYETFSKGVVHRHRTLPPSRHRVLPQPRATTPSVQWRFDEPGEEPPPRTSHPRASH